MATSAKEPTRTIFKALSAVQSALADQGISKDSTNSFDNYKYRGIDQVLNALAPILAKEGVLIMPTVTAHAITKITTSQNKPMNHAVVTVDYTLYDVKGDSIVHTAVGECMDRGDKAINKAMSAAFKYFLFQAFCIPLQGQDADSESVELGEAASFTQMDTEQQAVIIDLLSRTGTQGIDFVKWLTQGAEGSLQRLDVSYYDNAVKALEKKLSKMLDEGSDDAPEQPIDYDQSQEGYEEATRGS